MSKRRLEQLIDELWILWEATGPCKLRDEGLLLLENFEQLVEKIEEVEEKEEKSCLTTSAPPQLPLPVEFLQQKGILALFADGACRGNPGPGSYAAIAQSPSGEILFQLSGVSLLTTNNQMELMGAIEALQSAKNHLQENLGGEVGSSRTEKVFLFTDSQYVVKGINEWLYGWKKKGWKKSDGKTIMNLELWQQLDLVLGNFKDLKISWVKGHAGHPQNEYCDQLANQVLDEAGYI